MTQDRDGPAAEFKRVLALAMKTIACEPELQVAYGPDAPSLQGTKPKLPQVSADPTQSEVAITRGVADSFAMRLSNHDDRIHSHYRPEGKNARAMYEAVEQARVESIGARAMSGMAKNIAAMLDDRYQKKSITRSTDRKDAPLEEAVALLVRHRLTGELPPQHAKRLVDTWRPWIEDKAADRLQHLIPSIGDQAAFSRLTREIIAALDMADELGEDPDKSDQSEEEQTDPDSGERNESCDAEQEESQQATEDMQEAEGETEAADMDAKQLDQDDAPDDLEGEETPEGEEPWRPQLPFSSLSNDDFYRVFTNQFDEEIAAEDLCDSDELTRLRNYLDKQLANMQGVVARLANRLQRRLMAQQNRAWDFDLEEGVLDAARLPR